MSIRSVRSRSHIQPKPALGMVCVPAMIGWKYGFRRLRVSMDVDMDVGAYVHMAVNMVVYMHVVVDVDVAAKRPKAGMQTW